MKTSRLLLAVIVMLLVVSILPGLLLADDTFTVTFLSNIDGTVATYTDVASGTTIIEPDVATVTDYSFAGWYTDGYLNEHWDFEEYTITDNTLIYGYWIKSYPTATLTWLDSKGATITDLATATSYTFDFTGIADAMAYDEDVHEAIEEELEAFLYYYDDLLNYSGHPEEFYFDDKIGNSGKKNTRILGETIINDLMYSDVSSFIIARINNGNYGSDLFTVKAFDDEAKTFTLSEWAGVYANEYSGLLNALASDTDNTYLPVRINYCINDQFSLEDFEVFKNFDDFENTFSNLDNISKYSSFPRLSYFTVSKYENPNVLVQIKDKNGDLTTSTNINPDLLDYYTASSNIEKRTLFEQLKTYISDKLASLLNWDDGYGEWDVENSELYEQKVNVNEVIDNIAEWFTYRYINHNGNIIELTQHENKFAIYWDSDEYQEYVVRDYYEQGTHEISLETWQNAYETNYSTNISNAFDEENKKVKIVFDYIAGNSSTKYVENDEELKQVLDSLPLLCKDNGLESAVLSCYINTPISISWYDKNSDVISGLPTNYSLDLSINSMENGQNFYNEYKNILDNYEIFTTSCDGTMYTKAEDVMAFIQVMVNQYNISNFSIKEYNVEASGYIFKPGAEMAYKINYENTIDMWGYYNNVWLKTSYSNQGYALEQEGLDNADIEIKPTVVNGKSLLLAYTVTADEAISDGKLGIWTDVKIGDNDGATVSTIFENEKPIGFDLIDDGDHYGTYKECYALNAKYSCFVDGEKLANAIKKVYGKNASLSQGKFWYGDYSYADDCVFEQLSESNARIDDGYYNEDYTALYREDSGCAVSWDINLAAGESKTYYVLFGVVDSSMGAAPRFCGVDPVIDEEGYLTVNVMNNVSNGSQGHYILMLLDTEEGEQLDGGKVYLTNDTNKLYVDDTKSANITDLVELYKSTLDYDNKDQIAQFIKQKINAFPGTYTITGLTAVNDGGETTEYVFSEEGVDNANIVIPQTTRESILDLTADNPENKREGWLFDKDANELTLHGLDINVSEGDGINALDNVSINIENYSNGNIIKAKDTGINVNDQLASSTVLLAGEGSLDITAENGIKAPLSDITIDSDIVINSSVVGIKCNTLEITGGSLTINYESGIALDVNKLIIPENYEIVGGEIDENGVFKPTSGAKQLIIREKVTVVEEDSVPIVAPAEKAIPTVYIGEEKPEIQIKVDINEYINGVSSEKAVAPIFIENGRTYLGVRDMANVLGVSPMAIKWDDKTKTATISKAGATIEVTAGSNIIKLTYKGYIYSIVSDVPAQIKNDRIYMPFRVIFEAFGYKVDYNSETKVITCT